MAELRENHSGMETVSFENVLYWVFAELRENHSGMETECVCFFHGNASLLRKNHSGMETEYSLKLLISNEYVA